MELEKTLVPQQSKIKRYIQTRRFTGRRGLTPIKSKHKAHLRKTRGHKVEYKPYVPILKHTGSQQHDERKEDNKSEYSQSEKRQGNEDSHHEGKREDTQEHSQVKQGGNTENSKESIHPGPLQALLRLLESTAACEEDDKTEIEAEEITP